jgi:prepilin-type N-terminal cleavage/methylation domain-containing protein
MRGSRQIGERWVASSRSKTLARVSAVARPYLKSDRMRCRRAFTLLELLVAMTLMVTAAACLYTALYTGFRAQRSAQLAVEPTAMAINAIELLKQDIGGVLPPTTALAGAFVGTDSAGIKGVEADSLSFFTTHIYPTDDEPTGGLGQIELLLEEDADSRDGTYCLLRRTTTNLLPLKTADAQEQVLCRGVASLNLRYYDGNDWIDQWDSTADANSLPRAVEIDIELTHKMWGRPKELQKRRLVQSFAIPCQTAPQQTTTTSGSGT